MGHQTAAVRIGDARGPCRSPRPPQDPARLRPLPHPRVEGPEVPPYRCSCALCGAPRGGDSEAREQEDPVRLGRVNDMQLWIFPTVGREATIWISSEYIRRHGRAASGPSHARRGNYELDLIRCPRHPGSFFRLVKLFSEISE